MRPRLTITLALLSALLVLRPRAGYAQTAAPAIAASVAVPWTDPTGQRLAVGAETGLVGHGFGQGLRLRIPFTLHLGAVVRALSVLDTADADHARWSLGGRLELYGQSAVFLNLVRLYGGGGVQLFRDVRGDDRGLHSWGGGGQVGFEFFLSPRTSSFVEVGGSGGGRLTSGATVLAGMNLYPLM